MRVFAISYDLKSDTADYVSVQEAISKIGDVCQCLESTWLVAIKEGDVNSVAEEFPKCLKMGDRYFVSEVHKDEYSGLAYKKYGVWAWLEKQFDQDVKNDTVTKEGTDCTCTKNGGEN